MSRSAVSLEPELAAPRVIVAAHVATAVAAGLMLLNLIVELSSGAPAYRIFWPVEMTAMLLFLAAMTRQGRQWGRVTLTALVANTLVFRLPGMIGSPGDRQPLAMVFDWMSLAALAVAAVLIFLPAANAYLRVTRDRRRLVSPRVRRALLATHITSAVGWMGVIGVMATMAIAAAGADDLDYLRSAYTMMLLVDETFLGPAHQLALLTGIALAAGTPWGLWRRRWVATKLVLMLGIMLIGSAILQDLAVRAHELTEAGRPVAEIRAEAGLLLALLTPLGPLVGVAATLLSVYKPGGPTRYGRRRSRAATGSEGGAQVSPAAGTVAVVRDIRPVARDVVAVTLAAEPGSLLPAWTPGAHVDLVLPSGLVRQYSLCGDPADRSGYRIAVRRDPAGRGGSAEVHQLRYGQRVRLRGPRNHFPLVPARGYLFIAGGIGITPILPMVRQATAEGRPWRLVYLGRSTTRMPFLDEVGTLDSNRVDIFATDIGGRPDLPRLLRTAPPDAEVYCCGPTGLIAAVERLIPTERRHVERFTATPRDDADNQPFEAELARTGQLLRVPASRSLLDSIREVRPEAPASCENGLCGSCGIVVLDGLPDHRDDIPTARHRDGRNLIYPCVSRSHTPRLVLDL
ncbi:PDR/VanB family oxidoreductase [Plantactinospora sp. CA-294935]|uniref:PDR/VanB family oxidoreductase n=1 Tax=Plantactinospora sp. CA-294935 TaxID=3240012 RepID=UPI003D8B2796